MKKHLLCTVVFTLLNVITLFSVQAATTSDKVVVSSAPGKGIIPSVYPHYKQEPSFYNFSSMPLQHIVKGVSRRFVMGATTTFIEWHLKAGATLPLHYHHQEQMNFVRKGEIIAYSQGKKYILKPGAVVVFPSFVPHKFVAVKDSVLIGIASPVRADFLGGQAGVPDPSTAANKLLRARSN